VNDDESRSSGGLGGEAAQPGGGQAGALMHVEFDEPNGLIDGAGQG
jgi:hypothetical protein